MDSILERIKLELENPKPSINKQLNELSVLLRSEEIRHSATDNSNLWSLLRSIFPPASSESTEQSFPHLEIDCIETCRLVCNLCFECDANRRKVELHLNLRAVLVTLPFSTIDNDNDGAQSSDNGIALMLSGRLKFVAATVNNLVHGGYEPMMEKIVRSDSYSALVPFIKAAARAVRLDQAEPIVREVLKSIVLYLEAVEGVQCFYGSLVPAFGSLLELYVRALEVLPEAFEAEPREDARRKEPDDDEEENPIKSLFDIASRFLNAMTNQKQGQVSWESQAWKNDEAKNWILKEKLWKCYVSGDKSSSPWMLKLFAILSSCQFVADFLASDQERIESIVLKCSQTCPGQAGSDLNFIILGNVATSESNCELVLNALEKVDFFHQPFIRIGMFEPKSNATNLNEQSDTNEEYSTSPACLHAFLGLLRNLCISACGKKRLSPIVPPLLEKLLLNPNFFLQNGHLLLILLILRFTLFNPENNASAPPSLSPPLLDKLVKLSMSSSSASEDDNSGLPVQIEASRMLFRVIKQLDKEVAAAVLGQDHLVNCQFEIIREELKMAKLKFEE